MRSMEDVVEELRLVERIIHEIADASAGGASPQRLEKPSPLGWLADEPELADQLEQLTAEVRAHGRARGLDDENPR